MYEAAAVYDILHAPGTAADVAGLERLAGLHAGAASASRTWLEPACGTGRHLRVLAAHGHRILGTDRSPAAIEYASATLARRGLSGRVSLRVADMTEPVAAPGSIGIAFNTINSIRHLPDDDAMLRHFEAIARALTPGGLYAVGLSTTLYGLEPPTEDVWTAARGRCRVTQLVQYLPPASGERTETVVSLITVDRPSGARRIDDRYWLRTYSLEQWLALIDRSALTLHAVTDERGDPLDPAPCGYRLYLLVRR